MVISLQAYALFLVVIQQYSGVHTDEAKYLLDIPYPHPPAFRWFFDSFGYNPLQDVYARFFVAALLVNSVLFLYPVAKRYFPSSRTRSLSAPAGICLLWLFSGGLIIQGGTAMMSSVNAWQGMIFVIAALNAERIAKQSNTGGVYAGLGLFWLFSLFTGYQAVLYAPLLWWVYRKSTLPLWQQILYISLPVGLLALYTLSNPFAVVRIFGTAGKDTALSMGQRAGLYLDLWSVSGAWALSILGTVGIALSKRWDLIGAFLLLSSFIFLSNSSYYAILLTPLLVAGAIFALRHKSVTLASSKPGMVAVGIALLLFSYELFPAIKTNDARETANVLIGGRQFVFDNLRRQKPKPDLPRVLIAGPFGHEWQYYLPFEIVKYSEKLEDQSFDYLICTEECPVALILGKKKLFDNPVLIYK